MTILEALKGIGRRLERMDSAQHGAGLSSLADADLTWLERGYELDARTQYVLRAVRAGERPSQASLDALGAHVVSFKIAVAAAQEVDVTSGEEAA